MSGPVDADFDRNRYVGREIDLYAAQQARFDGTTSYNTTFHPHALEARAHKAHDTSDYCGPKVPFEGSSTYSNTFHKHELPEKARAAVPNGNCSGQHSSAKFEGISAYKDVYKAHDGHYGKNAPIKHGSDDYNYRDSPKFEGFSTYNTMHKQLPLPERPHQDPAAYNETGRMQLPFAGTSAYTEQYVAHDLASTHRSPANQRSSAESSQPSPPFNGTTTNREMFKPYPIITRPSERPGTPQALKHLSMPFQGISASKEAYQAWPIETTTRPKAPSASAMRPSMPFDGTTTNKETFVGWQLPARRPPIGVEGVGDRMHVLLHAGARLPVTGHQVFTTVHNNQTELCIQVLAGDTIRASANSVLGQFELKGLPAAPKGAPRIEITLHLGEDNVLSVTASDLDTHRHQQWLQEGCMVARV